MISQGVFNSATFITNKARALQEKQATIDDVDDLGRRPRRRRRRSDSRSDSGSGSGSGSGNDSDSESGSDSGRDNRRDSGVGGRQTSSHMTISADAAASLLRDSAAPCSLFAQGRCRHGSSCRFAHNAPPPPPPRTPLTTPPPPPLLPPPQPVESLTLEPRIVRLAAPPRDFLEGA